MIQEQALDILKMGHNIFLTGPAGSGKTFLLNKYIEYLEEKKVKVGVTASTGIAATHMGGVTIHSWSGMGIKNNMSETELKKILKKSYLKERFKNTEVLIIDEISMINSLQFDLLNRICQAFKKNIKPFGGIQIICSGDLFQLPPIGRGEEVEFVSESEAWKNMDIKICYLEEQHRQEQGRLYSLLNFIREKRIPEAQALLASSSQETEVSFAVSPKLYTHNIDVDQINDLELDKIEGEESTYYMQHHGNKNIVDSLIRGCLAPEKLTLKIGAKVMFVKNNFEGGYVNGTLGEVIGFTYDNDPIVKTVNGNQIKVRPTVWAVKEDDIVKATINQLPLRLAWAVTVHKSQGMNLDSAEIDLSRSFIEGMGYVALSRLRSFAGLKLLGINDLAFRVSEKVLELDKKLKETSQQVVEELKKISPFQKTEIQNQFLNSLSRLEEKEAEKEKPLPSYLETRLHALQKISIREIAELQGLKEETIISHFEKLISLKDKINLDYLKPKEERFNKVKIAFAQTNDTKLLPVKKILGDDYSFREIRIARLFI
ncbi:AAA family ATPase [Patescibacteria group bacterium]|nr:AAA family ATPase [Patescibacteria group bacterium]